MSLIVLVLIKPSINTFVHCCCTIDMNDFILLQYTSPLEDPICVNILSISSHTIRSAQLRLTTHYMLSTCMTSLVLPLSMICWSMSSYDCIPNHWYIALESVLRKDIYNTFLSAKWVWITLCMSSVLPVPNCEHK